MMFRVAIVALNPCVDRTLYLDKPFTPGDIHRIGRVVVNPAGKGLNQAVVFSNLGTTPDYFAFGAADGADPAAAIVREKGIRYHKTVTACGVRQCVKVIDPAGIGTELNEAGGPVGEAELSRLIADLDTFDGEVLSVCGSIPSPLAKTVYKDMIGRARARGLITVLDADGEALSAGLEAHPDYIKPNRRELAGLCGKTEAELAGDDAVINAAREIYEKYGTTVLCTMDADGSVCVGPNGVFRAGVAKTEMNGFSGAGDTYLAAFLYAMLAEGAETAECLWFAARAAAAKIALPGARLPDRAQIEQIGNVRVIRING